jgi:hypothetical protein
VLFAMRRTRGALRSNHHQGRPRLGPGPKEAYPWES